MSNHILIAFASGTGSTGEVADTIGEVFKEAGATVDVRPVSDVDEIAPYSAIVVGSSIRAGRWLPDGVDFLADFQEALAAVPVALFTTCLTMVDDTEDNRRTVMAYMAPVLAHLPATRPVGIGLFAGSMDPAMRLILPPGAGPHGDYRNWGAIREWAVAICPALLTGAGHSPPEVMDLSGEILAFTDLSHSDLSRVDLQGTNLHRSDLHDTSLAEANLSETDLTRADLHGSNLENANLHWSNLKKSNLREADLRQANLMGADLQDADLSGADLSRATLNGAILKNANLQQADLSHADLNWADFSGARLDGADLSYASLGWANLSNVALEQVKLQGAKYNAYTRWPRGFSPAEAGCDLVIISY